VRLEPDGPRVGFESFHVSLEIVGTVLCRCALYTYVGRELSSGYQKNP
jgi:hypothetical protein